MRYINNETEEETVAYTIANVIETTDSYCISLPDVPTSLGVFKTQLNNYIPQVGDFYIDRGAITDSEVMALADFSSQYSDA